jgi:hypothetical protein
VQPTASELLGVWERARSATNGRRALELAHLAAADAGALTPGERDAALLRLREELFGTTIEGVAHCPACGESFEVSTTTRALLSGARAAAEPAVSVDSWEVRLRPPTAADLATLAGDADEAFAQLLAGCVEEARHDGKPVGVAELPPAVVAAVDDALAAADPLADLAFTAACPACGEFSTTPFDVASFLWSEVERFALGTMREIHVLASAYGWTEDAILALGQRRRLYLELVEA